MRSRYFFLCLFALTLGSVTLSSERAEAFCGFYVSGADAKLYNNATMVVMMREGTKTVLSMQNNYEGPPQDFAMVVPVPVVLKQENVKTLNKALFDKIDALASPRLVEYWEQDPCNPQPYGIGGLGMRGFGRGGGGMASRGALANEVKIEAQFEVGEYEVVVLSATESNSLESWLKQNKYNIPDGAAPTLAPYIQQGMYFFVAKVNASKVKYEEVNGKKQATLSPLRFSYDSESFSLPVRLGLLNAQGKQDLIVHILAKGQRYEVANRPNVTIPTNLIVKDEVRSRFGEFYATLFDRITEEHPGAVVTEYAWDASTCDPCPGPALTPADFRTLGEDVLGSQLGSQDALLGRGGLGQMRGFAGGWVLTRLHARYGADELKEDLVFKKAEGILGGRGMPYGAGALLERGVIGEQRAVPAPMNSFQGRYIMLNPWKGEIKCDHPMRGTWGGPVDDKPKPDAIAAGQSAFVPRGQLSLKQVVHTTEIPGLSQGGSPRAQSAHEAGSEHPPTTKTEQPEQAKPADAQAAHAASDGKPAPEASSPAEQPTATGCQSTSAPAPQGLALWALLAAMYMGRRRRRRT